MADEQAPDGGITGIDIPFPETGEPHLRISIGPAHIHIEPAEQESWVTGTYHDPSGAIPLRVVREGGVARISHEFSMSKVPNRRPILNLRLGTAQSYGLTLETGASDDVTCELGGLPLRWLTVKQGAGAIRIAFSAPNPERMTDLQFMSGASDAHLTGLVNAGASHISIEGGAAAFKLDFGGTPQRNTEVRVTTGASSVEITIPRTTAARVTPQAFLGSVEAGDGFMTQEGAYWNEAAVQQREPLVSINVTVALGAVRLRSS